jgi:hypothetical protein
VRNTGSLQSAGRDGQYLFRTVIDFALDSPQFFSAAADRASAVPRIPDSRRQFRRTQYSWFAQDTLRVHRRLVLNYGIRYENFGAPVYTGPIQDFSVRLGAGASLSEQLAGATLAPPEEGSRRIHDSDGNDWAGRFGFSYLAQEKLLIRGAYGIFYDRLFDNAWQNVRNNSFQLLTIPIAAFQWDFLQPPDRALAQLQTAPSVSGFPSPALLQPGLRSAYAQNYFLGVTRRVGDAWSIEVNGIGSQGRKLVTTDLVNRNPALRAPRLISYRANQGLSGYHGLTASLRHRGTRGQLQASYTWSHAIDLQSEPLAGDFFDLSFARISAEPRRTGIAAFSRELDSRGDRGSSDFDQRHNLVLYSVWDLPGRSLPLRNWKVAQMAAFRTGFPFTVFAPSTVAPGGQILLNARADLTGSPYAGRDAAGGRILLDQAAFRAPASGMQGNTGRNAFRGPGMFNADVSLARSFALPWLGEGGRFTFRADAFNLLNHANLSQPEAVTGLPGFGFAPYGRRGRDSGFPAAIPFTETARQIQVLIRLEF